MAALTDKTTGLLYLIKRPSPETRKYSVECKKLVATISAIISIAVQPRGLVTEITALTTSEHSSTGTILYFRASGGTEGEDYELKLTFTDGSGNTIVDDIMLKVRIAGVIA